MPAIPLLKQISGASAAPDLRTVLPAIEARRAEPTQQLLECEHRFRIAEIARDRRNSLAGDILQPIGDDVDSFAPVGLDQPSAAPDQGAIETPP